MFFCFLCSFGSIHPQIDFDNVTAGVSAKYFLHQGEMGKYWQNSPGAGILLGYNLQNHFTLEGELAYIKINPKNYYPDYPNISFIELSGGIKFNVRFHKSLYLNIKSGLQNCMFIFSGAAADQVYEQNKNESEFGFFITGGLLYDFGKGFRFELNYRLLNILSSPETINIFAPGIIIFIL